ncbi:unnamed protein product [Cylicostephanus goldi]|uniref:Uncharacterized protein n=1 Tax=Cylicostephanus goldi TaxID=71465 RepID=A0A3P6QT41_CYLGO|nr:unnamed protein product [Cylicostephanus goldi]
MDHAVVRSILDEQCECTSLEVDGVAKSLSTFCSHLNKEAKGGGDASDTTFCGEGRVQLTFKKILHGTFNQVPGLPYFYYTPQHKESDARHPVASEMATFSGLFGEHPPRDVSDVVVRMDLYVMTWPCPEENHRDSSDSDSEDDTTQSERQMRFVEKLPKRVGGVTLRAVSGQM